MVLGGRGAVNPVMAQGRGGGASQWWTAGGATGIVAAYQAKGAASLAASYTNLANPGTYDAAPGVAPTWDAAGWSLNGTKYLKTGVIPASDWSMIVRYSDATGTDSDHLCGMYNASGGTTLFYLRRTGGLNLRIYGYGTATVSVSGALASGVMGISANQGYFNGIADGAAISSGAWVAGIQLYIGARNESGTAGNFYTGKIQAAAIYDKILSAAENAAIAAAMSSL